MSISPGWLTFYANGASRAFALFVMMAAVSAARAQVARDLMTREDGTVVQTPPSRNGFALTAEEDLAGTSLRLTGVYRYALFNAGGLCSFGSTNGDLFNSSCGQFNGAATYFHIASNWGVGIDTYRKIREIHPGIANMRQPVGYSTPFRLTSVSPIVTRIGPADGQFALDFSGATSANGEGCRDMQGPSGAGLPPNFTLLASADCPVTWGNRGFQGMRRIADTVWLRRFNANPSAFRWDDWKIPAAEIGNAPPIGDNSAYGTFSDFPREVVAKYGGVTPRGVGAPQERGFPLGISVRADAFKFDRASLRDGVFVRWLVINNSEKVWGTPIDYDSLTFGVDPGYIPSNRPNVYNIISAGVHVMTGGNISGRCNASTYPRRVPPGANEACDGNSPTLDMRFIMFLKSPLGDLRNKMFTATNPDGTPRFPSYYKPDHSEADDTITFNRFFQGGFGTGQLRYQGRSDRAWYGAMSGKEIDALDGRLPSEYTAGQLWSDFLYEGTDGTNAPQNAKYNKSAPSGIAGYGKWDWNDDGIPDTIKVPDCGRLGCAKPFADTVANGFTSDNGENIGSFLGVSEFSLKAGDTTEFLFYLGGVVRGDTIQFWRTINNVTDAYLGNYLGAPPAPVPAIETSDVQVIPASLRDSANNEQNVNVRLKLRMPPRRDDPYLRIVLDRLQSPEGAAIRLLNPTLVGEVTRRMQQNLAEVLVFKSCDGGVTWTPDVECSSAPGNNQTRDQQGNVIGIGWRPRFRLLPADTAANDGMLSSYVVSENVQAGREYLYSVVTKTRSLRDIEVVLSETRNAAGVLTGRTIGTLTDALAVDIDTVTTPLATTGASTVLVYAPLSVPAGTMFARFDTTTVQGGATNRLLLTSSSTSASGTYRVRFGNRFIVQRSLNVATNVTTTTVIRQSIYPLGTIALTEAPVQNFVAAADTFVGTSAMTYATGGNGANVQRLSTVPRATLSTPQTQVFLDTIAKAGFVLANDRREALYLAVGNTFTAATTTGISTLTAPFESAPNNPGFTVVVNGEPLGNAARLAAVVRAPGDTLSTAIVNASGVVYQSAGSSLIDAPTTQFLTNGRSPGGYWTLRWADDAFGPNASFAFETNAQLQADVSASLARRVNARSTIIDHVDEISNLSALPLGPQPRAIVQAKVPFAVFGPDGRQAELVFLQRHTTGNALDSILRNSMLLGTNGDTARIAIPPDMWMPGDTVYVVEDALADSIAAVNGVAVTVMRDTVVNGRAQRLPIQVRRKTVTLRLRLACNSNVLPARNTCNPLRLGTRAATGYLPYKYPYQSVVHLTRQFDQNSEVEVTALPIQTNARPLTKTDMQRIHVVPNPYIVQSDFDRVDSRRERIDSYIRFVNVPDEGMMRIYSISGQLVQQLSWTPNDLIASGDGSPHGDLPYNLRNLNGWDLVSGLYMYVITPRGSNANGMVARGKFVVIR